MIAPPDPPASPAPPPGLVIAAPRSGAGKTTVTLGLIAALTRRGVSVQPYKCGPDYIDPAFHAAAAGRPSYNLDSWAMAPPRLAALLAAGQGAGIAIAEGAMGLFDGAATRGAAGDGSAADIAAFAGWPVVLVLDVAGQAQTAAALAMGCDRFRPGVRLAGVILNRVASPRHDALARQGFAKLNIPVLGALATAPAVALPERHLGLVQAEEDPALAGKLAALADLIEAAVDLDALIAAAVPGRPPAPGAAVRLAPPGQRIALARDAAFSFVYPHLIQAWRAAGAEVVPFSPLNDEPPDPSCDACWLPGGYPELNAGQLAAAGRFKAGLAAFAATRPVHGECGGYMALGAGLIDAAGARHAMAGLLGLETSFAARRLHLGYRLARLFHPPPGGAGVLRGHEFHYASILAQPDEPLAEVTDASGRPVTETGARRGHVTGTFFHLIDAASHDATAGVLQYAISDDRHLF